MTPEHLDRILGLGIVLLVSLGALALLFRLGATDRQDVPEWMVGYPQERFPARDLTESGPLHTLAGIQVRLLTLFHELPRDSDSALWLRPFLLELRAVMDRAYRVAVITRLYGHPAALERLTAEVEQMEQQVTEHIATRLLAPEGSQGYGVLSEQLAMLRLCVDQLAYSQAPEFEENARSLHS